jgi:hypothetical protein
MLDVAGSVAEHGVGGARAMNPDCEQSRVRLAWTRELEPAAWLQLPHSTRHHRTPAHSAAHCCMLLRRLCKSNCRMQAARVLLDAGVRALLERNCHGVAWLLFLLRAITVVSCLMHPDPCRRYTPSELPAIVQPSFDNHAWKPCFGRSRLARHLFCTTHACLCYILAAGFHC